jgi:branched-chain amino acid transport system substrate-binding protein
MLATALALALSTAACGSHAASSSAPATTSTAPSRTVTLWVDVPLAGAAAGEGRQMLDGVRLVVAQSDYRVGEIGVRVRASDDADPVTGHSDRARCRQGGARAAADRTAIAVIGTYESACTILALPALQSAGLALIAPVNSDPAIAAAGADQGSVLVRLAPTDATQGTAAAAEAKALGLHRLYVLGGRAARALRMRSALVTGARSRHVAIVGDEASPPTASAVPALVARMRRDRADAVWIGADDGPGVVALLRALAPRASGATSRLKPIVVIGSDALYREGLLRAAGAAAEGLRLTSGFVPPEALGGAGADFVDAYARQFGEPGPYMAYAADAARLVLAALPRSDATRAGVLRAVLRTRSYAGLIGKVAIARDGASTLQRLAVFQVHEGDFRFERTLDLARS